MNFTFDPWTDWESNYRAYWDKIDEQAKKLDYIYPNWFNEIDLDRLYMSDARDCILTQLFCPDVINDDYCEVAAYFGLNEIWFAGGDLWWYTQILNRRFPRV